MPNPPDREYVPTTDEARRATQTLAAWVRLADAGTQAERLQAALQALSRFAGVHITSTILDGPTGRYVPDGSPPPN